MQIGDSELIESILKSAPEFLKEEGRDGKPKRIITHPLDTDILSKLGELKRLIKGNDDLYFHIDGVKELWRLLMDKAVKCLRFFDEREPYQKKDKEPVAYGMEDLNNYFEKYFDFEGLLYGSSKFYRDHVLHVFRTWLMGIYILITQKFDHENDELFIDCLEIEGSPTQKRDKKYIIFELSRLEKISMWTISSLCHDLGYPLEKTQRIFDKTKEMMEFFTSNPEVYFDRSFRGVQNYINDYIVKLISTKMVLQPQIENGANQEHIYHGRIQPKYYIKFSKSLEKYYHGIISAIILFKSLVYFLESDFNVNEDYQFNIQEAKQFNIKREILRSIASHTCDDIYHIRPNTFSFLLSFCDDLQEWDRKYFKDFYIGANRKNKDVKLECFCNSEIKLTENINNIKQGAVAELIRNYHRQFTNYKKIFRDGQDTDNRHFDFIKTFEVAMEDGKEFSLIINIPKDQKSDFRWNNPAEIQGDLRKIIEETLNEFRSDYFR